MEIVSIKEIPGCLQIKVIGGEHVWYRRFAPDKWEMGRIEAYRSCDEMEQVYQDYLAAKKEQMHREYFAVKEKENAGKSRERTAKTSEKKVAGKQKKTR